MNDSSVINRVKGTEFRIDRICRRFEQSWRLERAISIEQCLLEVEPEERPRLLEELLASEWELKVRRNERPRMIEYLERFQEFRDQVEMICLALAAEFANGLPRSQTRGPQEGDHLGDFRIIREIGRGGMGIVFEALQESLDRHVALKVLPARRFQSERELIRFSREAKSVARLHHSNIVEVYGVGEQDGVHYFAMRFIDGRSLDEVIRQLRYRLGVSQPEPNQSILDDAAITSPTPNSIHTGSSLFLSKLLTKSPDQIDSMESMSRFRAIARIGQQVASALQYAHERGVIHRDVKPSNLILDRQDVCWLTDFGLAKIHLDAADITDVDDLVGTMRYMSPEALDGKIDPQSDLYSLGLTLYELLTLQPALNAAERGQLIEQVRDPHPIPPRRICSEIPRDLETVILKAISVNPAHRYLSAGELADDLERFLSHEPIHARPQGTFTRFRRWIERKPLLAFLALGTVSITLSSVLSFVALYQNSRITAFKASAERQRADLLQVDLDAARKSISDKHKITK